MTARLLGTAARFNSRNQRLSDAASHPGRRTALRLAIPATWGLPKIDVRQIIPHRHWQSQWHTL